MAENNTAANDGQSGNEAVMQRLAQLEDIVGAHNEVLNGQLEQQQAAQQQAEAEAAQQQQMDGRRQAIGSYADQNGLGRAVNYLGDMYAGQQGKLGMGQEQISANVMDGLNQMVDFALQNGYDAGTLIYQQALQLGMPEQQAEQAAEQAAEQQAAAVEAGDAPAPDAGASEGVAGEAAKSAPKKDTLKQVIKGESAPAASAGDGSGEGGFSAAMRAKKAGDLDAYARNMARR